MPEGGDEDLDPTALMARISEIPGAPEHQDYAIRLRRGEKRLELRAGADLELQLDQRQDIGCMQDFLAGAAVFALAAEGRLDPYAPIDAHFPELGEVAGDIRAVDLLAHASGFPQPQAMPETWEALAAYLTRDNKLFPPGQVVNYGTTDYLLLLEFVERATGEALYRHLERLLFAPAGIDLNLDEQQPMLSRRPILARLDEIEILLEGVFDPCGLWGQALLDAIGRDQAPALHGGHMAISPLPIAYSWGVGLLASGLLGLNGNTADGAQGARVDPVEKLSIIGRFNANQVWRGLVFEQLAAALGRPSPATPPRALGGLRGLEPAQLAGNYRSDPQSRCQVYVNGRNLNCLVFREDRLIANIRAFVEEDGLITGASRMPYGRLDFFPHPVSGERAMTVGAWAYAAENN